ncbi:MarR family winged helix-turn-helix transcriptional regulator [Gordonia shandongensis]|uniref:MarR family winged helix-turn-helix transcriptional regulator n=1 Tax=Gordonia shandongensis TaxID=376351 RepID=UPI0003FA5A37|nr:MarR family transcriptional regulator [Gordonia shandongensis]
MIDEDQARSLLAEAVELARAFQVARNRSHARGLTGTRIGVLKLLRVDDSRMTDLAETLMVSLPVTSRAVASLEADGYVVRRQDPDDARASLLSLSQAGRDYVSAREAQFLAHFSESLGDWTADDAATAEAALSRLRASVIDAVNRQQDTQPSTTPASTPTASTPTAT